MDKEKFSLLSNIKYPEDLRKLSIDELPELCRELREDIIEEVAVNPGHFASSLGVVEITVALHYIYNTPYDRIVWDESGYFPEAVSEDGIKLCRRPVCI